MNGTPRVCIVGLICTVLVVRTAVRRPAHAAVPHCAPAIRAVTRLPARIDSLLALDTSGTALALAGPLSSSVRFLPRDGLLLLARDGRPTWRAAPPPYITPPGLAVGDDRSTVYVVVDNAVLLLSAATGRLVARRRLDMQALGWPAAIVMGSGGRLYVVGQPARGWAAVVEAVSVGPTSRQSVAGYAHTTGARAGSFDCRAGVPLAIVGASCIRPYSGRGREPDSPGRPATRFHPSNMGPTFEQAHVIWRTQLGLFHAGIWLGAAQGGQLAVYLPGVYDAPGAVALLDERTGSFRHAYAAPAPPLAADAAGNRLYIEDAGSIRALALDSGRPVASAPGRGPLAVVPRRGLVAFAQGDGITLAAAGILRPLAHITLPDVTALAATPDGAILLLGLRGGLVHVDLDGCSAP